MREQARRTGAQRAAMTCLAQRLGRDGYKLIRELGAGMTRNEDLGFAGKAGLQVSSQKLRGERALAAEMVESQPNQIVRLAQPETIERFVAPAARFASAQHIYGLALRACRAVAWQTRSVLSYSP